MLRLLVLAMVSACALGQQYQAKVAPGVPPQKYQQPPPPQQYQPPPPQHQQVPVQQQFQQQPPQGYQQPQQGYQQHQVPQQQVPQQVPQQQVPQHQQRAAPQHGGHGQHGDPQLLNPSNIAHERDHIQEHMDVPIDTSKMSEQELQFHYFKMHDADNNNKLDGCELIKSLIHWHGQVDKDHQTYTDKQLEDLLEHVMSHTDRNKDGYVDYLEYRLNHMKAQVAQNANK